jgi:hypothetical protein
MDEQNGFATKVESPPADRIPVPMADHIARPCLDNSKSTAPKRDDRTMYQSPSIACRMDVVWLLFRLANGRLNCNWLWQQFALECLKNSPFYSILG